MQGDVASGSTQGRVLPNPLIKQKLRPGAMQTLERNKKHKEQSTSFVCYQLLLVGN
jgi:hypothetical protein